MDGIRKAISPQDLYSSIGTAASPLIIDVRRPSAFDRDDALIVGAIRRLPDSVDRWGPDIPKDRRVVAYCVQGQQASQGVAAASLPGANSACRRVAAPARRPANG
jgi:rhodanese-related sulfurtransferase